MRRTDFCHLTFLVPAPVPRQIPVRHALARLRDRRDRLPHVSAIRFGGPHVFPCRVVHRGGRCLPAAMRDGRASDTPVASPTVVMTLARLSHRGGRRDRRPHSRVNDACGLNDPRCLPSVKSLRPATPFRAPGSGFPRLRGLATAMTGVDVFSPGRPLSGSVRARPPSTRPRCQRESRFSGPRRRLPTSATETTHGHTLRAFVPRARVRLSPRCSPAPTDAGCVGCHDALPHREPASHDLHVTACAAAFHSRGRGRSWAEALERRRTARSWTKSRVPSSWRLGHPCRRCGST
jgi:hypothetical protein